LGIGASSAVFTVVNGVLLRPLPFANPDALVTVRYNAPGMDLREIPSSDGMYFTYHEDARAFEGVGAWNERQVSIAGRDGVERVLAVEVTSTLFPLLGVEPTIGRLFADSDDLPGAPKTVVLSHSFWLDRFGGDPAVLGTAMQVEETPREILGVMPPRFALPQADAFVYIPLQWDRQDASFGGFRHETIGRLKPNVALHDATADVQRMIPIAADRFITPGVTTGMLEEMRFAPVVRPFRDDYVGDVSGVLWLLLGTVGIVFLIACTNVANLSLVRVEGRRREVAIRAAIGAGRGRIARHLLLESLLLGLMGGLTGLCLALAGVRLVLSMAPEGLPRLNEIVVDPATLAFTAGAAVVAALIFGLLPLLRVDAVELLPALRATSGGGLASRERHRLRNALVVAQIAMAVVLLAGSGLMLRSFLALREVDPGFSNADDVLTFRVTIPETLIASDLEAAVTLEDLARRIRDLPGVESVSATSALPMEGRTAQDPLLVEDVPWSGDDIPPVRRFKSVMGDYSSTVQHSLIAGREIEWTDIRDRAPVAVVTENFAIEYWGNAARAVGERIAMLSSAVAADNRWHEIVGVVGDVHDEGIVQSPAPVIFWPMVMYTRPESEPGSLFVPRSMAFVVRSETPTATLIPEVRAALLAVNASLPLTDVRTLDRLLAHSMAGTSFAALMLLIAAGVALLLGIVGVYGVVSFIARLRSKEFGVRIALGAEGRDVTRMVLRQGAALASAGIGVGLLAAIGLTRLMSSLLYGVEATDPATFAAVVAILGSVAMVASYLPAMRASRTDPLESLTSD
jgi:predicted permease